MLLVLLTAGTGLLRGVTSFFGDRFNMVSSSSLSAAMVGRIYFLCRGPEVLRELKILYQSCIDEMPDQF
jgi:hypothetical protein